MSNGALHGIRCSVGVVLRQRDESFMSAMRRRIEI
jgi:hypothetical protein